jgi:hypothetical protein
LIARRTKCPQVGHILLAANLVRFVESDIEIDPTPGKVVDIAWDDTAHTTIDVVARENISALFIGKSRRKGHLALLRRALWLV